MADTNDTNDIVSEDNFIGTDSDGNSYYADDDGNVAMVDSDGSVTTESKDEQPSGNADNYEGVEETYDTDTSNDYTFDDSGNLVNADTGEAVDTSHWGDVIGEASVAAGGEKTPIAGYTYTGTDKKGNALYSNSNGRQFTEEVLDKQLHNAYGGDKDAKAAANIAATFGPAALNNSVLDYYSKDPNAREIMSNAAAGNGAAQALIAAMTGTVPTNVTDDRVYEMLADMEDRIAKGEDAKSAYENAGNKAGLTSDMSSLKSIVGLIGPSLIAGPLLSAGVRGATAGRIGSLLNKAGHLGNLSKTSAVSNIANASTRVGAKYARRAMDLMDKGSKVAGLVNLGTGVTGAALGAAGAMSNSGTGRGSSSSSVSPYNQPNQAAQGIINGRTRKEESGDDKLAAAETTKAPTPSTTKPDPVITFSNPFGREEPEDISIPKGPLEGTSLSGIGLPEPEDPKAGEERGFEKENSENSDSGDDTLESTTQDAPTGGVGTETFANPNNDNERKSWGLSEEDPNRANYDIDKWNRGMERVSTDVVSDAKCKDFITKTYSKDPVLIKMVKIMKTKS